MRRKNYFVEPRIGALPNTCAYANDTFGAIQCPPAVLLGLLINLNALFPPS